jgi:ubiquitin C-terminal hydrolase
MKKDLTQYHGKGYTGLINLGNTCFLNSCLQVLNHTYELNDIIKNRLPFTGKDESLIYNEWIELQNTMWTNNGVVSPNRFVNNIQKVAHAKDKDLFTGWAQNDMPEFLLFMIECFHNSIARPIKMKIVGAKRSKVDKMAYASYNVLQKIYEKEYSEVYSLFYAIYVSEITSMDENKTHTLKPEMFFMLDLPIPTHTDTSISIYDCFNAFTKTEILDGENAWKNDSTGRYEAIRKRITFWNFPDILVITLKRFCPYGHNKLKTNVVFPLNSLDLSKYVSGYNKSKYIYDLYGVCNHEGGVNGGHYTAFVLNSKKEWLHFNDENVSIVDNVESVVTPMAYCLFYRIRHKNV